MGDQERQGELRGWRRRETKMSEAGKSVGVVARKKRRRGEQGRRMVGGGWAVKCVRGNAIKGDASLASSEYAYAAQKGKTEETHKGQQATGTARGRQRQRTPACLPAHTRKDTGGLSVCSSSLPADATPSLQATRTRTNADIITGPLLSHPSVAALGVDS